MIIGYHDGQKLSLKASKDIFDYEYNSQLEETEEAPDEVLCGW